MNAVACDGFDWDDANRDKCQKHGLTIGEIESVFAGEVWVGPDPFPSEIETRFRAVGMAETGRHAFIVFTMREAGGLRLIRPVSARYMHAKEVEGYERSKGA